MNGHPKFRSKKNGDFRFYQDNVKIQFTGTHVKLESLQEAGGRTVSGSTGSGLLKGQDSCPSEIHEPADCV